MHPFEKKLVLSRRITNLFAFSDEILLKYSFMYMKLPQTQILQSQPQNTILMA